MSKVMKSFRLDPRTVDSLGRLAVRSDLDNTAALDAAIRFCCALADDYLPAEGDFDTMDMDLIGYWRSYFRGVPSHSLSRDCMGEEF